MAAVIPNRVAVAKEAIRSALRRPPPVHVSVTDTDQEQGLPLRNMQPISESGNGLRLRPTPASTQNQEESLSTAGTLIPDSSAASPKTEAPGEKLYLRQTWQNISSHVKSRLSGPSVEETERLKNERGYNQFIDKKVDTYPKGFPRMAALQASHTDFTIFRGFKNGHVRALLHLEVELTELEKELSKLDDADSTSPITKYRLRNTMMEEGWDTSQTELIHKLRLKLVEYDDLLLKYTQTQALGKPPQRNHLSVWHWIYSNPQFDQGYYDFMLHPEDFLSTRPRESNYFEEMIQDLVFRNPNSIIKKFLKTPREHGMTSDPRVNYYSDTRLSTTGMIPSVSLIVGILLIPEFVLFLVPMTRGAMAVTATSFIFLFAIMVSTIAQARLHEVFFGTATYAAVLMVFLGAVNQGCAAGGGS
ncbi:hypothetical protein LSUE1_G002655 [Lachnellula suecica]|uniref:DUF6594 domain-containing protein n=1 Tax=Lachnellula suecica TaxID=602035 RepID=A0A8T9CBK9_9HELO|nr:hypothetical protein LSUE1_G002655 [Lachnellula suecica]